MENKYTYTYSSLQHIRRREFDPLFLMAVVKKTLVIVLVAAILSSISPCYEAGRNCRHHPSYFSIFFLRLMSYCVINYSCLKCDAACAGIGCNQLDATPCVDPIKNDADHCTTATCALRCLTARHRTRSAYCKHEGSKYECCCPPWELRAGVV